MHTQENTFDVDINDDFKLALDLIDKNHNFYITGNAGTGKSTFLKYLVENSDKNIAVLAPTGKAAINCSGQTIHSFFSFPPALLTEDKIHKHRNPGKFKALEILVIDEVSMVRADLMDAIDTSLRINRNNWAPFGGVQMILFGDLAQLPPVVKDAEMRDFFEHIYESPFFFSAMVFNQITFQILEFTKIYRQQDPEFISILNKIRVGRYDGKSLEILNKRLLKINSKRGLKDVITLTTTNNQSNLINVEKLSKLKTKEKYYEAEIMGKFPDDSLPTEQKLTLKVGAQVMMIKNDQKKRWFNGTLARIKKLHTDEIIVEINKLNYNITREAWKNIEYVFDRITGEFEEKVVGTFKQFPIRLAYAITIHKCQGMTLDKALIDLSTGAFASGQIYVALSRCKNLNGIYFRTPIKPSDIYVDHRIQNVYSVFNLLDKN
jgi:ATP-dependent exoDNAse (exonuclease V) alpha subunit